MERIVIKPGQEVMIDGKVFTWNYNNPKLKCGGIQISFKEDETEMPLISAHMPQDPNWVPFKFDEILQGHVVRNKGRLGINYMVTGNYGGRASAVKVVDITNPDEWEVLKQQ